MRHRFLIFAALSLVCSATALAQSPDTEAPQPGPPAPGTGYPLPAWGYPPPGYPPAPAYPPAPTYPSPVPHGYYPYPPPGYGPDSFPTRHRDTRHEGIGSDARLGQGMHIILSVAPLFGYEHTWRKFTTTGYQSYGSNYSTSTSTDTITLFGSSNAALAFDLVFPGGFTVGTNLQYGWQGGSSTIQSGSGSYGSSQTEKAPSASAFSIGGRGGYLHMFSDIVGIWATAGGAFRGYNETTSASSSSSSSTQDETSFTTFSLESNVALLVSPVRHFAFVFGLGASYLLNGNLTYTSSGSSDGNEDLTGGAIGLGVGLLGYL